jgi:transposase
MREPIALRPDYDAALLRGLARESQDPDQVRRLLALAVKLVVPHNITIVLLPPKCPELNPQENVWQFIRDNRLSNRVFDDLHALIMTPSRLQTSPPTKPRHDVFRRAILTP